MATTGALLLGGAATKVIGIRTGQRALENAAFFLFVAAFAVALLPLFGLLVYLAVGALSGRGRRSRRGPPS
jgi:hypothetical protein